MFTSKSYEAALWEQSARLGHRNRHLRLDAVLLLANARGSVDVINDGRDDIEIPENALDPSLNSIRFNPLHPRARGIPLAVGCQKSQEQRGGVVEVVVWVTAEV